MKNTLTWYTDRSMIKRVTDADVSKLRPRVSVSTSLGELATVSKAEITECSFLNNINRAYLFKKTSFILSPQTCFTPVKMPVYPA